MLRKYIINPLYRVSIQFIIALPKSNVKKNVAAKQQKENRKNTQPPLNVHTIMLKARLFYGIIKIIVSKEKTESPNL